MTLRLVNDDDRNVVPCEIGCGPATILVIINNTPGIPCCDKCARRYYGWAGHTSKIRLAPLSEYVDMYAAAKEGALATPEQITGSASSDADTYWVFRRMYEDRAIYCRMMWCTDAGQLTPADLCISTNGEPWHASCGACAQKAQGDQVKIWPLGEDEKSQLWALVDGIAKDRLWTKPEPRKPVSRRARIITGLSTLGGLTLGTVMVTIASKAISDFNLASQTWEHNLPVYPSYADALQGWGIFFIVVSILAGLIWLSVEIYRQNPPRPRPVQTASFPACRIPPAGHHSTRRRAVGRRGPRGVRHAPPSSGTRGRG